MFGSPVAFWRRRGNASDGCPLVSCERHVDYAALGRYARRVPSTGAPNGGNVKRERRCCHGGAKLTAGPAAIALPFRLLSCSRSSGLFWMLCSPGRRSQSLAAAFGKSRRLKSEGACDPRSNSITIRKHARRPPARAQLSPRSQNFKLPIQNCTYEIRTPFINPERRQHLQHCARSGRLRLKRKNKLNTRRVSRT